MQARTNSKLTLDVAIHDPMAQVKIDSRNLEGVWRSILTRGDKKATVNQFELVIFRQGKMAAMNAGSEPVAGNYRLQPNGRIVLEADVQKQGLYRLLNSGRLEIGITDSMLPLVSWSKADQLQRFERIVPESPRSKTERLALEMYRSAGTPDAQLEFFVLGEDTQKTGSAIVTSADIVSAEAEQTSPGSWALKLELTDEASDSMRSVTSRSIGKKLGTFVDGKLQQAPVIQTAISGSVRLEGFEEAMVKQLADSIVPTMKWNGRPLQSSIEMRKVSFGNLRKLVLGLVNYENAFDELPASASTKHGPHPVSWRVQILPYIGYKDLYEKYKLDEPWDSDHNRTLLDEMPSVYRHPSMDKRATHTAYVVFAGEDMVLGKSKPTKLEQITDSDTMTIAIVESKTSIPWTQPLDLTAEDSTPLTQVKSFDPSRIHVSTLSGTVRAIDRNGLTEDLFKRLITINDGF